MRIFYKSKLNHRFGFDLKKAIFDIAKTEEIKAVFKKAIQKTFEKTKIKEKTKSKQNDFGMGM